jgi:hypothetical protein
MTDDLLETRKATARAWFEDLRDKIICPAFEQLEDDLPAGAPLADQPAGRFVFTPWERTVNISEGQTFSVTLQLSPEGIERWQTIERFTTDTERERMRTGVEKREREAEVEMRQKRTDAEVDVMREQSEADAYRKKQLADGEKKKLEESYERIEGAPAPSTTIIK